MRRFNGCQGGRVRRAYGPLLVALALFQTQAPAIDLLSPRPVTASLWAERDGIAPGQPFVLGLRLSHAPGWHSYWRIPGDSGLPTRLSWHLPQGISAGELQWPAPRRLAIGPLVDYGYEGEALLMTELRASPGLSLGSEVRVEAHAQWLMCRDVCIPASEDLAVTLPVHEPAALRPTSNAQAFERARASIPRALKLGQAVAVRSASRVTLGFVAPAAGVPHRLEFFPLESGRIEPSAPQLLHTSGSTVSLELTAVQPAGADFRVLRGVLVGDGGLGADRGWIGTIEVPITAR
jgi:DsbC/DsbD-like thiol-disulfide interchange protein